MVAVMTMPRFSPDQFVRFIGGEGKVRKSHADSGRWSYLVEMEMGEEPEMGRIGFETMILLPETDLEEAWS
ncbi:hypothetical protein [Leptolyngbya sp. NIES-2104]|uniref:hypothetical protein n=1 Tax=Leptolyngbya sp. NIES-2104 TaxID=1552121 RepID=UPI0006ECB4E5|nr:hypothetical protein [Leptolyngbya sp. NIES-2104]GAP94754.1 hypothetical protein NIES2104_12710 [Leptolyngbya sp. NIES-2104]